ncbi:hypothetical protein EVJ32_05050 [Exiguobacterium sp. SH5S4]|uniref:NUMOD3 domain-containing DNA-binding protein n=1 Tax=Exiguobacterium sp. SH5S4 TaxID=2510961 RepID=UPI00103C36ED|nr:NUMOD3 domain-containing DNA-binding protein [Exiguobacterium sp. SH5S4]TCI26745.1 hypothetical protein EVJ32_05050 [Exiguobacterium sp. SH5S4]
MKKYSLYVIMNKKAKKYYVGISSNPEKRKITHFSSLSRNSHHNLYLQRSYNKNGADAFEFIVLFDELSKEKASEIEVYTIKTFKKFLYNISRVSSGGDIVSYHPNNAEIRKKISKASRDQWANRDEEFKRRMSERMKGSNNHMYGQTHDEEARRKISAAHTGRRLTKEHKEKMVKTRRERYTQEDLSRIASAALKKRYSKQEERDRTAESSRRNWQNPEYRSKMEIKLKEISENRIVKVVYKGEEYEGNNYQRIADKIGLCVPTLYKRLDSKDEEWSDCWRVTHEKRTNNFDYSKRKKAPPKSQASKDKVGRASSMDHVIYFPDGKEKKFYSGKMLSEYLRDFHSVGGGTVSSLVKTGEPWKPKKYIHKHLEGIVIKNIGMINRK